jgi:ABC-type nitrate/sulfonate/bicarbonate transport system ATPase subunit
MSNIPALDVRIMNMRHENSIDGVPLIADLNLTVAGGRIAALLGPTAAGKTTLLRMIAGFNQGFNGTIHVYGQPPSRPCRNVQLVFQDYRLFPWMTVEQNIAFALDGNRPTTEVEECLRDLGLSDRRNAFPKTLSGGEAARTALGRALIGRPKLLLLDEPFRNLDYATKISVQRHLLKAFADYGTTGLLVSHSVEDVLLLADDIHILTRRPMSVIHSLEIPLSKPRKLSDPALGAITSMISELLLRTQ